LLIIVMQYKCATQLQPNSYSSDYSNNLDLNFNIVKFKTIKYLTEYLIHDETVLPILM
jgi:hypothetical protein